MSLAQRLQTVHASRSNAGCTTCHWLETLADDDRRAIAKWLDDNLSVAQLHELLVTDPDNPLPVSDSAFRNHIRRHHRTAP